MNGRTTDGLRARFDDIYDTFIVGGGFFESDDYYKCEKERYWHSLIFLCRLLLPGPARILEIGGGQLALMCNKLFNDNCVVADISQDFAGPLNKVGIDVVTFNLLDDRPMAVSGQFDFVLLLEVIEHLPLPPHVAIERIKPLLKPSGFLFLTTPNLFRLRNLIRMILGIEFLDRFTLPVPGRGLGHQLEYSADHLKWQLERAGMDVVMLTHSSLGRTGHSASARAARKLLAPLDWRAKWRSGLVAAAKKHSAALSDTES